MKSKIFIIIAFIPISQLFSQVGIGTTNPAESSMLEISSQTNGEGVYRGFMPPRVPDISARNSINPTIEDEGLLVYVLGEHSLYLWTGTNWETIYKAETGGFASDLFISEYVEGSGNNKAIEIANFTGSPKYLDNYNLFISRNGGAGGTSNIPFNENFILNHGEVYVISHASAMEEILNIANQIDNRINFNGNDAVVLRNSSDDYIDVIGEVNVDWNFGEDITLRRRPLHGPNTTYNPSHFIVYGTDNIDDLGQHTYFP